MMRLIRYTPAFLALIFIQIDGAAQDDINAQMLEYKTGIPVTWSAAPAVAEVPTANHSMLFENDWVSLIEMTIMPGGVLRLEAQAWPCIMYIQEAGDFIDLDGRGTVVFDSRNQSEPPHFPMAMWIEPEVLHTLKNLSQTEPLRLVRVDMKK